MIALKLLSCLFILAGSNSVTRRQTVRIFKIGEKCPEYDKVPITFKDIHINLINRIQMISLKVVATRTITSGLKLELILKRCQTREALDTCEKYQTIHLNHLCDLINAENKPWTPFTKFSNPPLGCPVKKGVYTVTNGTFDGSAFSYLPIAGWYWVVTAKISEEDTNQVIECVFLEAQLIPI